MSGQQQSFITKKRSNCHGNQRLQRFRRQCRAKGLSDGAIGQLVLNRASSHTSAGQMNEEKDDAMTNVLARGNGTASLSESTPENQIYSSSKYQCLEGDWSSMMKPDSGCQRIVPSIEIDRSKPQHSILSIDHWKQSPFLVPQNQQMARSLLQESLTNALPDHHNNIMEWLADSKEIELNYWNSVIDATGPVLASLSIEANDFTRDNYIHWDYPQTMKNIQHRQQLIRNKLRTCQTPWNHHTKHLSFIENAEACFHILHRASNNLVEADLRHLSTNLNEKLIILDYDIHDIQLVKSFYDMLPNQHQIHAVRRIWRLKYKSGKRATIQKRLALTGHAGDKACHNNFHYQGAMQLANDIVSTSMRKIVQARLRNLGKRNDQIYTFQKQQSPQQLTENNFHSSSTSFT